MNFQITDKDFVCDGRKIKLISGAVHYFRNMPDTWRDIFKKMRALGCNCVETYCAWNMHEKTRGSFCFEGNLDIAAFVRTAAEEGLLVIVRPGPYICAEWEFGGLPYWIQNENMEIRCSGSLYISCFENYLSHLFDQIRPLLCTNGGPIIMMQCENEYGYYGDDKNYLRTLYRIYRDLGIDVPLFTSDGTAREEILDGCIEGCLSTLNFGSNVEERFKTHDELFPNSPKMCMEMWCGWFDAWGDSAHHRTPPEEYAKTVDDMLKRGSLNMYMFIGGTNFGFTSGANHGEKFLPDVTSYDYDALLSECGDITEKYMAVREVVQKYTEKPLPPVPENRRKKAYGQVLFSECAPLLCVLDQLSSPIASEVPQCMEAYGAGYGYILYRTKLGRNYRNATLSFEDIGDRAHVYIGDRYVGTVYVNDEKLSLNFDADKGDILTILCENLGRTNFGPKMMRKKGIIGRCLLNRKIHFGWEVYPLPMENLALINTSFSPVGHSTSMPTFYRAFFEVNEVFDTFLRTDNFRHGFAVLNGFNLGRYWEIGPQKTLYVPASLLKKGKNELILFEADGVKGDLSVEFTDTPSL